MLIFLPLHLILLLTLMLEMVISGQEIMLRYMKIIFVIYIHYNC
jgi:hypothetical protein